MRKKFLVFGSPLIGRAEIKEVLDSLKSGWLGTGPKVKKFEESFGNYKGVKHSLAVNSCTAAMHLAMCAIGIKPGDEVLIPTMTFAATANIVIHAGGIPILVDCERDSMNISLADAEKKITKRTKAIIPVHMAGRSCNMDALELFVKKHNLKMIEDCAHAVETEYHGRKVGTFGEIGCFSFYVTKNLVTGEGGMAITNNKEYANKIKVMALHGMSADAWKRFGNEGYKHYEVIYPGFKYNMMDIQAALGIHQLKKIEKHWIRRQEIWKIYNKAFSKLPVFLPATVEPQTRHAYHLYTILLDLDKLKINRDQFLQEMTRRKIGVGVHFVAVHLHPHYRDRFGYKRGDFPNAEWISERTVSLPISPKLSARDVEDVIEAVTEILTKYAI